MNNLKILLLIVLLSGCSDKFINDQNDCKYLGCKYLGAEYVLGPLGEEQLPDTDPLIRYDAFDCVTFVETSLANGDKDKLTKIRYKDGKIGFLDRNHFTETDWLINNADLFKNVTGLYGETKIRNVTVNKKEWFKKVYNLDTYFTKTTVGLEYIPYANIYDIKNKEELLVLFIINNPKNLDNLKTDIAVAHMGFLLPDGKLRHASQSLGRVVDVDFKDYVAQRKKNKTNLGVALYRIQK